MSQPVAVVGLLLLLASYLEDVFSLLAQDTVHGCVLGDDDLALNVSLGRGEAELDEANLGALDARWGAGDVGGALGKDEAPDKLSVVDGSAVRLDDLHLAQVHVRVRLVLHHCQHRVHGQRRQHIRVLRHDLGCQRRGGSLDQLVTVR